MTEISTDRQNNSKFNEISSQVKLDTSFDLALRKKKFGSELSGAAITSKQVHSTEEDETIVFTQLKDCPLGINALKLRPKPTKDQIK